MSTGPTSNPFMDMFTTFGRDLKLPKMDVESILEHNRKNLEALQKATSASAKGATDIMQKQRDLLQEQMHEISSAAQTLHVAGNPHETLRKQSEFVRKSFETAVKNTGEVAQMMQKSSAESIDILRSRIRESMDEIRQGYEKGK